MCFRPPQPVKKVKCPACGFMNLPKDKKCAKCGADLPQEQDKK